MMNKKTKTFILACLLLGSSFIGGFITKTSLQKNNPTQVSSCCERVIIQNNKEVGFVYAPSRAANTKLYKEYWYLGKEYRYMGSDEKTTEFRPVNKKEQKKFNSVKEFKNDMRAKYGPGTFVETTCVESTVD